MKFRILFFLCFLGLGARDPKIIGLMQVRNEATIIEQTLRILALYTDSIIVLDDASDDETVDVVKKLAQELNIEKIICKTLGMGKLYRNRK